MPRREAPARSRANVSISYPLAAPFGLNALHSSEFSPTGQVLP
jgi:hypothetical protein